MQHQTGALPCNETSAHLAVPTPTTTTAAPAATTAAPAATAGSRALVVLTLRGPALPVLHFRIEILGGHVATGRMRLASTLLPLLCARRRRLSAAGMLLLISLFLLLRLLLSAGRSWLRARGMLLLISRLLLLGLLLGLLRVYALPRVGAVVVFLPARASVLIHVAVVPGVHIA